MAKRLYGNEMDVLAAIAFEAGQPLQVETVQLDGPRAGKVLVEIKATGICHTDKVTRSGEDPEGLFPAIFGHEGAGVIRGSPGRTGLSASTSTLAARLSPGNSA